MAVRVGIPQALLYYDHYPAWKAFLQSCGCEVVRSGATTEQTLRRGVEVGENELCLPVKTFFGHVVELDGEVDVIFVPRVVSMRRRTFTCPKLLGLPDMSRAHGLTSVVVAPLIDLRRGWRALVREAVATGEKLGATPKQSVVGLARGVAAYRRHEHEMRTGKLLRLPEGREDLAGGRPLRVGVAGHPYNIYDTHTSNQVLRRLAERGIEVLTPDMLSRSRLRHAAGSLPKPLFWSCEERLVGAVQHWVDRGLVDGVIYMLSFACGPDSFVEVLIEDAAAQGKRGAVPLLSLVMDEHGAEAGFVTRIEAFVDMLGRRHGRPVLSEAGA
ncbi:MAG: hypothetical protein IBX62_07815 [Coriobacteriia bacterium]|nr:hypothetical protein [Coriobacteriia bacterium]